MPQWLPWIKKTLRGQCKIAKGSLGDQCPSDGPAAFPAQAHRETSPLWYHSPGLTSQTYDSHQNRSLGCDFARLSGNRSGLAFGSPRRPESSSILWTASTSPPAGWNDRRSWARASSGSWPRLGKLSRDCLSHCAASTPTMAVNSSILTCLTSASKDPKTLRVQFTRSRPYKKDDNAHVEQKNWTHVRKLLGWERYDTLQALKIINQLYRAAADLSESVPALHEA